MDVLVLRCGNSSGCSSTVLCTLQRVFRHSVVLTQVGVLALCCGYSSGCSGTVLCSLQWVFRQGVVFIPVDVPAQRCVYTQRVFQHGDQLSQMNVLAQFCDHSCGYFSTVLCSL